MPFKSLAQMKLMYSKHPQIAQRWSREAPVDVKSLPVHVKKKKKVKKK